MQLSAETLGRTTRVGVIRRRTFRVLAGILGAGAVAAALLLAAALPAPVGFLLLLLPEGFVFLQFSFTGAVRPAAWVLLGASLVLLVLAGFLDVDSCLDAGGSYAGLLEGCVGASPAAGLLLQGGGTWQLWLLAVGVSCALALLGFRVLTAIGSRLQRGRAA